MALPLPIRPALWLATVALLLTPLTALAFSLGEIEVTGSYKKQFSAQIPAYVDGQEGLEVELGNVADYIKVGARRPRFIDDLSVIVSNHPSAKGAKLIRVVSSGPIDTPSFNLVIKAKLGAGRVMENYFLAVDFQRKLAVESDTATESDDDLLKIAEEMRRMREGIGPEPTPQPGVTELPDEKADDMITRMREEERQADAVDRDTQPATVASQTAPSAEQKLLDKIRRQEKIDTRADGARPTPEPTPEPTAEPKLYTNESFAADRPNEPGTIVIKGEGVEETTPVEPTTTTVEETTEETAPAHDETPSLPLPALAQTLKTGGAYQVSRGDTLSELAEAAGDGLKMTPQLVVALWKMNPAAFINGNIHGVRAGANLTFAGVLDEAAQMTRTEAARILQDQWNEWTGRTGGETAVASGSTTAESANDDADQAAATTSRTTAKPTNERKIAIRSAALSIITSWRDKGKEEGLDLDKATMGERAGDLLEVSAPKQDDPDTLVTLILKRNPDGTLTVVDRIETRIGEKVADDPQAARRYVAHVASFKDEAKARKLVSILRRKGYDAYETGDRLDGEGEWYRVAVGRFGDREAGFAFARSFRAETGLTYTRLLDLPYALQVGVPADEATALATIERLEGDGLFGAYLLSDRENKEQSAVMLGAFATTAEVKAAMNMMKEKGYDVSQAIP